ncbi:MAG: helix-turn-helix domain-containing protein [Bacteroidales bacterium]|jgi:AraC-like DNA-binding protein|nr:helix-turn-helix domain-containing protein [Bacteroidales bacterium]
MDFVEPILYIGIAQSFFAGLLLATRRPYTTANRLINAWIFLICAELIFALLNQTVLDMYAFPFIAFTYGPILYLYVRHMTMPSLRFSPWNGLHFIPFTVFFTVSVIFREDPIFDDLSGFFVVDRFISLRIVYGICFFLSISVYSILSFIVIRQHQARLRDIVSYTSAKLTLNWLKILSITFYTGYILVFILGGMDIMAGLFPYDPYILVFILITFFSFAYSFYAIRQPEIFDQNAHVYVENGDTSQPGYEKYARSGLKDTQAEEYLTRLLKFMDEEKPYLNGDLTIHDISSRTGIPRYHITEILNEKHGRNFFTFINEYRVKEVISRINDARYQHYTILAIAFDSGFNSKSTFNTFFKSFTGKTPSQYRAGITGSSAKV